jgi:DMSO/TMAO reductase YedYZ heme-binding membrane subunit
VGSNRGRSFAHARVRPGIGGAAAEHMSKIYTVGITTVVVLFAFLTFTGTGHTIDKATQHFMLYYAGVFALIALCASTGLGLAATDRRILDPGHRVLAQSLHRAASFAAVAFLAIHILTEIAAHRSYILDSVVPFLSPYRTFYVGLGTIASDLMVLVVITGIYRKRFTTDSRAWRWRAIHYTSYVGFVLGIWHGLLAGRTAKPYVDWSYGFLIALVVLGLALRIFSQSLRPRETLSAPVFDDRVGGAASAPLQLAALGAVSGFGRRAHAVDAPVHQTIALDPQVDVGNGPFTGPQPRMTTGPQARVPAALHPRTGTGPQPRVTTGPQPRVGTGPMPRVATGPQPRVATGPMPRMGTGPQPRIPTGPQPRIPTGPMPRAATGPQPHAATGPQPRVGTGPMPRVATGPQPRVATGPMPRMGTGPQPRVPTGPMPRAATGPQPPRIPTGPMPRAATGPQPRIPTGPMPRAATGPQPRMATGPQPRIPTGPQPRVGTGPLPRMGSGPFPRVPTGPQPRIPTGPMPRAATGPQPRMGMPRGNHGPQPHRARPPGMGHMGPPPAPYPPRPQAVYPGASYPPAASPAQPGVFRPVHDAYSAGPGYHMDRTYEVPDYEPGGFPYPGAEWY